MNLAQALDRLCSAPLDGFLPLRKQLVAELRTAGDAAGARELAATVKPTRTAWALNQVARRQPELLQALFQAREAAAMPSPGDADQRRRTTRDYRDRLNDVVRAAHDILAEGGVELNALQSRRVAETLQAACAEDGDARARLVAGTLTQDLTLDDPFAGVAVGEAGPAASNPPPTAQTANEAETKADDAQARKRADEERERRAQQEREARERAQNFAAAQERVARLEEAAREADANARATHAAATRAARVAKDAKALADEAQAALDAARAELERLTST